MKFKKMNHHKMIGFVLVVLYATAIWNLTLLNSVSAKPHANISSTMAIESTEVNGNWSEDFDDGNLDDWIVTALNITNTGEMEVAESNVSVSQGYLESFANSDQLPQHNFWNWLTHNSTIIGGTWSFDWKPPEETSQDIIGLAFDNTFIEGTELPGENLTLIDNMNGYRVDIYTDTFEETVEFHVKKVEAGEIVFVIEFPTALLPTKWYHVDVTLDEFNVMSLYVDGELKGTTEIDLRLEESLYFFVNAQAGSSYDNISLTTEVLDIQFKQDIETDDNDDGSSFIEQNLWLIIIVILLGIGLGGKYYYRSTSDLQG